jgi:hypothetical protein
MTPKPKPPSNQLNAAQSRALLGATRKAAIPPDAWQEAHSRMLEAAKGAAGEGLAAKAKETHASGIPADCLPTPASRSAMLLTSLACQPSADEANLNRLERAYLGLLRANIGNAWVGVQCVTLKLGDDCRYTPDFFTIGVGGEAWAHEVKGFMRDDAQVKLKVAARKFPWVNFCLAMRKGGVWTVKPISP